jgi:F-type H+-transporting ATPase subunit b
MHGIMVKIERITFIFSTAALIGIMPIFCKASSAATDGPILSLDNTNFVVSIAFLAFIIILLYLRVPAKITNLLDNRKNLIRDEIDGATSILEESKTLLAELEREHKANILKAEKIVQDAETESKRLLAEAKREIRLSIERKIKLAEEQIKATEHSVIKSIKDRAIDKAFLTAEGQLVEMPKSKLNKSIVEDSLKSLDKNLKKLNL